MPRLNFLNTQLLTLALPKDETVRKDFFLHNDIGLLTREFIKHIYFNAQRIMELSQPGD